MLIEQEPIEVVEPIRSPKKRNFVEHIKRLLLASESSSFQIKMVVLFLMASFFTNMQFNNSKMFYMNPVFNCDGSQGKIFEEEACRRIDTCHIQNTESLTAELSLFCGQRTTDRVYIQSASGIGCWFGILFAALMSDRFGRKFCFCLSIFIMNISCLMQFLGIRNNVPILLVAAEVLGSFSGKIIYVTFLVLCTRFLQKKYYEIVTLGWLMMGVGIGEIFIAIINQIFFSWRLLFAMSSIGILLVSISSLFALNEDPIYYFDMRRYEECKKVVKDVAVQNGSSEEKIDQSMKQMDQIIAERQAHLAEVEDKKTFDLTELCQFDIMLNSAILGVVGCCYNMSMSSVELSIQSFALTYNENLFIIGVFGIIGYFTAFLLMRLEQQRKRGFLFSSFVCAIAGMMFYFRFCTDNPIVQFICISVLRLSLCWIGNYFVRLKVDLFPEKYQGTMVGYIELLANFGRIFTPLLTQISLSHHLNAIFSINLVHIVFGTIPIFFIIETIKKEEIRQERESIEQQQQRE